MPPGGDIFAGPSQYFQNLAVNRANQRMNRLQVEQGLLQSQQQQRNWQANQDRLQAYLDLQKQKATEASQAAIDKHNDVINQRKAMQSLYGALRAPNIKPEDAAQFAAEAAAAGVPSPQIEAAMKLRFGAAGSNPADKFYSQPLAQPMTGGAVILQPDGEPFPDPTMTKGDALKNGGVVVTGKDKQLLQGAKTARQNLQSLLEASKAVLPMQSGALQAWVGTPLQIKVRAAYDPRYTTFEHSKAGLIQYMRDLAGVGRVNQTELNTIIGMFQHASTYPAMQAAVNEANHIIDNSVNQIATSGRMHPLSQAPHAAPQGDKFLGWAPNGKKVYQRSNGTKYLK